MECLCSTGDFRSGFVLRLLRMVRVLLRTGKARACWRWWWAWASGVAFHQRRACCTRFRCDPPSISRGGLRKKYVKGGLDDQECGVEGSGQEKRVGDVQYGTQGEQKNTRPRGEKETSKSHQHDHATPAAARRCVLDTNMWHALLLLLLPPSLVLVCFPHTPSHNGTCLQECLVQSVFIYTHVSP